MPGILERIKDIELELSRTQKNKATEHHTGLLKAKLSQLRKQLLEPGPGAGGGKGEGFDVVKSGNASIALIGFPSVGKSSFLNIVCGGAPKSAESAHEFTTLTCIPGLLEYNNAKIQILDLPGIIEGASKGKGRGKQVTKCILSLFLSVLEMRCDFVWSLRAPRAHFQRRTVRCASI